MDPERFGMGVYPMQVFFSGFRFPLYHYVPTPNTIKFTKLKVETVEHEVGIHR